MVSNSFLGPVCFKYTVREGQWYIFFHKKIIVGFCCPREQGGYDIDIFKLSFIEYQMISRASPMWGTKLFFTKNLYTLRASASQTKINRQLKNCFFFGKGLFPFRVFKLRGRNLNI